jgi:hypothetical protein
MLTGRRHVKAHESEAEIDGGGRKIEVGGLKDNPR